MLAQSPRPRNHCICGDASRAHCESNDQKRSRSEGKKTQRGANARWEPAQRRIDGYSTRHAHGPIRHRRGHATHDCSTRSASQSSFTHGKVKKHYHQPTRSTATVWRSIGIVSSAITHGAGDFAPAHRSRIDFTRSTRKIDGAISGGVEEGRRGAADTSGDYASDGPERASCGASFRCRCECRERSDASVKGERQFKRKGGRSEA